MRLLFLYLLFFCFCLSGIEHPSIGIFTCKVNGVGCWDPDSINSGIAGSEEAVIYLSKHLADLGYTVTVYGNPPPNSPHSRESANPRYIDVDTNDEKQFDFAVAWRMPSLGLTLRQKAAHVYLWPHDTIHYRLPKEQIETFDDVFWLSEWQRQQWMAKNPEFSRYRRIFGNGIEPDQFTPIVPRSNPHSLIYGSNYARGLEILLDNWPAIKDRFSNATLDIYYGWQHWGLLSPEKEAKMRRQISDYKALSVVDHERVSHEELNNAYAHASIWAYPCIAPETFCITALRAQGSGTIPVVIEGTALSETVRGGFKCSTPKEYLSTLFRAMESAEQFTLADRKQLRTFVFEEYTWKKIAEKWHSVFQEAYRIDNSANLTFANSKFFFTQSLTLPGRSSLSRSFNETSRDFSNSSIQ
ncbi:hypothetical protein wcw_1798 [Waddlia chondrophila WSU 86-1044]|uniref:Glycosyl transferase family 1 domain-containing protein n=1 Tax=Waddlia chondrophila (strain ATCC VR-1470 / WSU 86-1044) TaxID=716544 RepID=D6YSU2_WADCW|nr:hypothetical protein wcw_1798 [Waddlia chondrophila WSU 86-1044]